MSAQLTTDLIKQLLVACDQSYAGSALAIKAPLNYLSDQTNSSGDYGNPNVYRSAPQFAVQLGYKVAHTVTDAASGGKVVIYGNEINGDVIVAFAGTDGSDLQDWVANTQSAGWNQWNTLKSDHALLSKIAALNPTNVHFTGQSLGGALAQYAAYDYVKSKMATDGFDKSTVTLATFNGLGAVWGLQANGGYDASILAGIGDAVHYMVRGDLVSRLGDWLNGAAANDPIRILAA